MIRENDQREQMANGFQSMPESSRVYSTLSPNTMAECPTQYDAGKKNDLQVKGRSNCKMKKRGLCREDRQVRAH